MGDETFEEAVEALMDRSADTEDRVLAARHMGASDQEGCFNALLDICQDEETPPELASAAGKSLRRVAATLDCEDEVDPASLIEPARDNFETAPA